MGPRNTLNDVANSVIADLLQMSVSPLPECYEVWFTHKQGQNLQLSQEIEARIASGAAVDTDYITGLYRKYCSAEQISDAIEQKYTGILGEVEGLKDVAKGLSQSANSFGSDIKAISHDVDSLSLNQGELKKFINLLVETTAKATARNAQLETELNSAAEKIVALHDSIREIEQDAHTDFLTKLSNRRRFDKAFHETLTAAHRDGALVSLIVCDVDHFKKFNDTWGHHIGDQVLKFVGAVLKKNTKGQDIVARYGGEEFAIALPNTSIANAERLAENIRAEIARRRLVSKTTNEDLGTITMSFGVAEIHPGATCESLFQDADAALYRAKGAGRNRVVLHEHNVRRIA